MKGFFLAACLVSAATAANTTLPVVIWHGMGDTCCFPWSMGYIKEFLLAAGVPYVHSISVGDNMAQDEFASFFGSVNSQIELVQKTLAADPMLKGGFHALGFSQGGQFLRAYVQRYNDPPVRNLVTIGSQHLGVSDIPKCTAVNTTLCALLADAIGYGVYLPFIRDYSVQAQYFRDPMQRDAYTDYNVFLPDINNERPKTNAAYKARLTSLENFVMVRFNEDTTVVPLATSWFEGLAWGSRGEIVPLEKSEIYTEDRIGLKVLAESGRLHRLGTPGDHMQLDLQWFQRYIVEMFFVKKAVAV